MVEKGYHDLRSSLHLSDPRLRQSHLNTNTAPISGGAWRPWSRGEGRVVALELSPDNTFGQPAEYTQAAMLETRLQQSRASPCEVYLLEGLCGGLWAVLGTHLQLHPSLFMDHERLVACGTRMTGESGGLPFLPSTIDGRGHVSFKYHEPAVLSRPPRGFRNLCATSGRHLAITRLMGELSSVALCRRKCTFWCRSADSGGWTCLIICDPPIRRILTDNSGREGYDVVVTPYNSGYLDFVPLASQLETQSGPPRSSMLEDVLFYLRSHATLLDLRDPLSLRVIVEKIVASQYLKAAEFLQSNIEIVQWSLSRKQDLARFDVSAAEEIWSDIQAWDRRAAEYQDDLEGIVLQLHAGAAATTPGPGGWKDSAVDFRYLTARFGDIGRRGRALNSAVAALARLAGNRTSVRTAELSLQEVERGSREARTLKALTVLGILFLPLSFLASIFSMSERYLPGSPSFWVYLAISFPLLLFVIVVFLLVDLQCIDRFLGWHRN
ncbi:hypothetical protein J3F83DRAFT_765847 [Trichoderma novae-zelandiae]